MELNKTHRGTFIKGVICTRPGFLGSVTSIIEDQSDGQITFISFYNLVNPLTFEAANRIIPKGTKVIIIEPLFKQLAGGTRGIRVDNPNEVIFGSELPLSKSSEEYKDEGGKLFKTANYIEALICYEKSLELLMYSSNLITLTLLSNAALSFSKVLDEPKALLFALGASALGESSKSVDGHKLLCKVYFRLFRALKTLGGASEEEAVISSLIKNTDHKFWCETAELKASTSVKIKSKDESMVVILRMCAAPLLHLLQGENSTVKMSEAAESEYRLNLKDQGRDCFQKSEFANASALYLKAA